MADKSEQLVKEGWNWLKRKFNKAPTPEQKEDAKNFTQAKAKVEEKRRHRSSFLISVSDLNTLLSAGGVETPTGPPTVPPTKQPTHGYHHSNTAPNLD